MRASDPTRESLTRPAAPEWAPTPAGLRRWQGTAALGAGERAWRDARAAVLRWEVKTRSGFLVSETGPVRVGGRVTVTVRALGRLVREPVEVIAVVDEPDRSGFAYRTLPGHPIRGEEAFVVEREGDEVRLTIRSLTRPAERGLWRLLFPVLLLAQRLVRGRYLRALLPPRRG